MNIEIKKADLVPYVCEAMKELRTWLDKRRVELGDRYNPHNNWEKIVFPVGPYSKASSFTDKYLAEYLLMQEKRSTLSATTRNIIAPVFDRAVRLLYEDKTKQGQENENSKE